MAFAKKYGINARICYKGSMMQGLRVIKAITLMNSINIAWAIVAFIADSCLLSPIYKHLWLYDIHTVAIPKYIIKTYIAYYRHILFRLHHEYINCIIDNYMLGNSLFILYPNYT